MIGKGLIFSGQEVEKYIFCKNLKLNDFLMKNSWEYLNDLKKIKFLLVNIILRKVKYWSKKAS